MKYILGISLICMLSSDTQSMCRWLQTFKKCRTNLLQQRRYNAGHSEHEEEYLKKEVENLSFIIKCQKTTINEMDKALVQMNKELIRLQWELIQKRNLALKAGHFPSDISDDPSKFYIKEHNMHYGNTQQNE